jgi:hypothetical protein
MDIESGFGKDDEFQMTEMDRRLHIEFLSVGLSHTLLRQAQEKC